MFSHRFAVVRRREAAPLAILLAVTLSFVIGCSSEPQTEPVRPATKSVKSDASPPPSNGAPTKPDTPATPQTRKPKLSQFGYLPADSTVAIVIDADATLRSDLVRPLTTPTFLKAMQRRFGFDPQLAKWVTIVGGGEQDSVEVSPARTITPMIVTLGKWITPEDVLPKWLPDAEQTTHAGATYYRGPPTGPRGVRLAIAFPNGVTLLRGTETQVRAMLERNGARSTVARLLERQDFAGEVTLVASTLPEGLLDPLDGLVGARDADEGLLAPGFAAAEASLDLDDGLLGKLELTGTGRDGTDRLFRLVQRVRQSLADRMAASEADDEADPAPRKTPAEIVRQRLIAELSTGLSASRRGDRITVRLRRPTVLAAVVQRLADDAQLVPEGETPVIAKTGPTVTPTPDPQQAPNPPPNTPDPSVPTPDPDPAPTPPSNSPQPMPPVADPVGLGPLGDPDAVEESDTLTILNRQPEDFSLLFPAKWRARPVSFEASEGVVKGVRFWGEMGDDQFRVVAYELPRFLGERELMYQLRRAMINEPNGTQLSYQSRREDNITKETFSYQHISLGIRNTEHVRLVARGKHLFEIAIRGPKVLPSQQQKIFDSFGPFDPQRGVSVVDSSPTPAPVPGPNPQNTTSPPTTPPNMQPPGGDSFTRPTRSQPDPQPTPTPSGTPTDSKNVVAFEQIPSADPVSTFLVTEDRSLLVLAHESANKVTVHDLKTGKLVETLSCISPSFMLSRNSRLYVAQRNSGRIAVYNQFTWRQEKVIPAGVPGPYYMSAPLGKRHFEYLILVTGDDGGTVRVSAVDVKNDRSSVVHSDPSLGVATVDTHGKFVVAQSDFLGRFQLPQGQILMTFDDLTKYGTNSNTGRQRIKRASFRNPDSLMYQSGDDSIFCSLTEVHSQDDLSPLGRVSCELLLLDETAKLFYTIHGNGLLTVRSYDVDMNDLGSRAVTAPVQWADTPVDVFSRAPKSPVAGLGNGLRHPYAMTLGGKTYLFVYDWKTDRVAKAVMPPFGSVPVVASTSDDTPEMKPKPDEGEPATASGTSNEKLAAGDLSLAKAFLFRGKNKLARRRLQDLIRKYPDTEAAKDAKDLLAEIPDR